MSSWRVRKDFKQLGLNSSRAEFRVIIKDFGGRFGEYCKIHALFNVYGCTAA